MESLVKQCGAEFRDILGELEDSAKKKGLKPSRRDKGDTEIWKNVITHSFTYIIKELALASTLSDRMKVLERCARDGF